MSKPKIYSDSFFDQTEATQDAKPFCVYIYSNNSLTILFIYSVLGGFWHSNHKSRGVNKHWPQQGRGSTGHPRKTCTDAPPREDQRWPQRCSDFDRWQARGGSITNTTLFFLHYRTAVIFRHLKDSLSSFLGHHDKFKNEKHFWQTLGSFTF